MDRVIYLAMAGAKATMQRQDVLAQNVANATTAAAQNVANTAAATARVAQATASAVSNAVTGLFSRVKLF